MEAWLEQHFRRRRQFLRQARKSLLEHVRAA